MARSLMKGVKVEKPLLRVPAKIGQIASDGRRSVRSTIHLGQSPASDQRMIACASNHLSGERRGASSTGRMVTPKGSQLRGRPEWRNLEKDCGQEPEWRTPA
jgi:hypothetical protein